MNEDGWWERVVDVALYVVAVAVMGGAVVLLVALVLAVWIAP